jgi:hypothetical protein
MLGAGYTSDLVRCDLLQIADSIWCICHLVSEKNHSLSFFLHQIADARTPNRNTISHAMCKRYQFRVRHQIADTPNRMHLRFTVNRT